MLRTPVYTVLLGFTILSCMKGYISALEKRSTCADDCLNCSNMTGLCDICKPGRWGRECEHDCISTMCFNNVCNIDSGDCTYGCLDGMYHSGQTCKQCPDHCKRCKYDTKCLECEDGWHGNRCDKQCSRDCRKCEQTYSGMHTTTCLQCSSGKYGSSYPSCIYDCSLCKYGACTVDGCTHGCIPGYYYYNSITCIKCFPDCASCSSLSWDRKQCLKCPPGHWGDLCDKSCSLMCNHVNCNQSTGQCTCMEGYYWSEADFECRACLPNCRSCDTGDACAQCSDGYFGSTCQFECDKSCLRCEATAQNCVACPAEGYFLVDSKCRQCPVGCLECNEIDYDSTVACSKCFPGFYKDITMDVTIATCYRCPVGCSECNWKGECRQCAEGYHLFLRHCCPDTCKECVIPDQCTICESGYHGRTCNETCASNETGCAVTGKMCQAGSWGESCHMQCSPNCRYKVCEKSEGKCYYGCGDGFHGDRCDLSDDGSGRKSGFIEENGKRNKHASSATVQLHMFSPHFLVVVGTVASRITSLFLK